ncbi:MAG: universal stress protein [Burkholderiales bacterium]|nr:universal stress protein [Burkholderiales bacterium]
MFKHILIPTDGSELAGRAVKAGLEFAKGIRARVTLFIAMPEYTIPTLGQTLSREYETLEAYDKRVRQEAEHILSPALADARSAGVEAATEVSLSDAPYQAIIGAASRRGCDLIFMASHGRHGLSEFLHGSQAHGVITPGEIPTLVYRQRS